MTIGGFVPFTLSDFPGRVAAIVFTQGCNFRCPFCHNAELLPDGPGQVAESDVLARLEARADRVTGVVVSGGEPTLQPDLGRFCTQLKARGLAVKLDTNGSRPEVLEELLDDALVDYVAMDVKAPRDRYGELAGAPVATEPLWRSMRLIAASGVAHQFRTTYVEPLLSQADLDAIGEQIPAGSPHVLQSFRAELALDRSLRTQAQRQTDPCA